MRILKLILFCIVICLLSSIGYGQVAFNFGATSRTTDTSKTAGIMVLNAYKNSNTSLFLTVNAAGKMVFAIPSGGSGSGTVTSIKFNYPLIGGTISTTGTVSIAPASPSVSGYLDSNDFGLFYSKQDPISLTTTGISGPATFDGFTINVPQYAGQTYTAGNRLLLSGGAFMLDTPGLFRYNFSVIDNFGLPTVQAVNTQINASLAAYQPIGNYITALTGDVTATGPGSATVTIANGAINNAKIANGTIDLTAKVTGILPIANGGTNATTTTSVNGTPITYGANNSLPIGSGTVTSVGLIAGTSMSVTGTSPITGAGTFTVTNTAPDQTVVLNNGTGISNTGTYPNFTITNTAPDQTVTIGNGSGISVTGTYPAFTVAATNSGTVTSVSGTANRITSTGGNTPVIDISAAYVGQTSINTLGTVSAATWQATSISTTYTDAKVVSVSGTSGRITSSGGGTPAIDLATAGTAGTYGGAAAIPVVTTDAYGRVTTITTVSPSTAGTVTTLSVVSANGFAGTVSNPTTTPAVTLTTTVNSAVVKANGTAFVPAVAGTDYQAAGNYITALTGDVAASGPGSSAATLSTVNSNVGSFGSATQVGTFTVNGKGLITAASNTTITGTTPGGSASGDLTGTYPGPTLAAAGTAGTYNLVTFDSKGRETSGSYVVNPFRIPVSVATTAALTVTYSNGSSGVGATLTNAGAQAAISIDGVSLSVGDRLLVYLQASTFQNGIYQVTTVGSGATNWVITRTTDFDGSSTGTIVQGATVSVSAGTTNTGVIFIETGAGPFTIGTTPITFTGNSATSISGGYVASVTAANGSLSITPTTGAVAARINNAFGNAWTVDQTINGLTIGRGGATVTSNTAIGEGVLANNSISGGGANGTLNTGCGDGALAANTTGAGNTAVGSRALEDVTTGTGNTSVGDRALGAATGTGIVSNTAVGQLALQNDAGNANTGVGAQVLSNSSFTGGFNTGIGYLCLQSVQGGGSNTAIGASSGNAITSGSVNVLIGASAGAALTTGSNNVFIGGFDGTGVTTTSGGIYMANGAGTRRFTIPTSGNMLVGTTTDGSNGIMQLAGNLALNTAGNKINIATGTNASAGTSGAMTAGTITISTTAVTASSIIMLTGISTGAPPCASCGDLSVGTITAGTSFVINSSLNTDTRAVYWWIIN